jgi:hypothetical protein
VCFDRSSAFSSALVSDGRYFDRAALDKLLAEAKANAAR